MSRYNRCKECFNMKCVFVTGERTDFDTSECPNFRSMTNADRIRSYTDEELAEWVWGAETAGRAYGPRGKKAWLEWLKQEVGE